MKGDIYPITDKVDGARKQVRDYLAENGYFNVDSYESNLDNTIHPIFDKDKFRGITDKMYQNMLPALHLASLFIQDQRVLGFFWYQMRGEVAQCVNVQVPGKTAQYETRFFLTPPDDASPSEHELMEQWDRTLTELSADFFWKIYESNKPDDYVPGQTFHSAEALDLWVQTAPNYDLFKDVVNRLRKERPRKSNPAVLLHKGFRAYLNELPDDMSDVLKEGRLEYLAVLFMLAKVLVHEIAHAVHSFPRSRRQRDGMPDEVYANLHDAKTAAGVEPGLAWEEFMFGGTFVLANVTTERRWERLWDGELDRFQFPALISGVTKGSAQPETVDSGGSSYLLTTNHKNWRRFLLPHQWVVSWFNKGFWADGKQTDDIVGPPVDFWSMGLEVPADDAANATQMVRVNLQAHSSSKEERVKNWYLQRIYPLCDSPFCLRCGQLVKAEEAEMGEDDREMRRRSTERSTRCT